MSSDAARAIVSLVLIGSCGVAAGADPRSEWGRVQELQPGDRVRVYVRGKEPVTAVFGAATPETLQLSPQDKQQIEFRREEVRRVERLRHRAAGRAAAPWIGAAAGFGVGFAIGYPTGVDHCTQFCILAVSKPVAGALTGVAGAGIGVLAGHFVAGKGEDLICRPLKGAALPAPAGRGTGRAFCRDRQKQPPVMIGA